ncbi:MAG TPA: type IV pilus assembly protein PilM [Candidatus Saccharimonadales bacterium]|nr:type IV pilus assembly protein PilM [Candidatus Saccharimonadales bacterium]
MGNLKFYHDEPLFGLDIGHSSLKAMQIRTEPEKRPVVSGYGISYFDPGAIQNGTISQPEVIAGALHELFEKKMVGKIDSRRVACTLPTAYTFSRPMKIPPMAHDKITEAVHLEAEQYIPIPIDSLYVDYEVTGQGPEGMELLVVAASKKIVDSYLSLLQSLDLEPVAFEPSINASSRLLKKVAGSVNEPSLLVDMGSIATDIAIFDKTLIVSSTVSGGGDTFTAAVANAFRVSTEQATQIKNQYGIAFSDRQQRVIDAVKPQLDSLVHEIQKSLRFYAERAGASGQKISRIITIGGGAVMPGFNQYISKALRLPTENLDPWKDISFEGLHMPDNVDLSMYITVAGEAVLSPSEILS